MQEKFYNPNTATTNNSADTNLFIQKLFNSSAPLNFIQGAQSLANIINLSDSKKILKRYDGKVQLEGSKTTSLKESHTEDQTQLGDKPSYKKDKNQRMSKSDASGVELSKHENAHEIDSFVKLPVKKAKNEIIRQPEPIENKQLIELGGLGFNSDSENIISKAEDYVLDKNNVCFIKKHSIGSLNHLAKPPGRVFDFLDFIQRRDDKTRMDKVYACKYCPKVYAKRAALGGHTAKNHPHLSDSYKVRQLSMNSRKIERERFDFFKHL